MRADGDTSQGDNPAKETIMDNEQQQDKHSNPTACYADRVGNFTPINPIDLVEKTGLNLNEVLEFFDEHFGGIENYIAACSNREALGRILAQLNDDQ